MLETNRLIIRKITLDDAYDVYEYAKNKKVGKDAGFKPHESVDETISIIETILKRSTYSIVLKEINKVIGTITLQQKLDDIYELGYSLGEEYWNKGIMTEAVKALVKYAFTELNAYEVDAGCFIDNIRSEKVLIKSGFKFMGIHEKDFLNYDNKYKDSKRYRLLKSDYMEG
ncbi:MAG: GNAT family N-acetyltransferase [Acholeplasmatales bacterium]|nr:GNAT family N-acetyltransferase [Acholeplasmatales bacterium]